MYPAERVRTITLQVSERDCSPVSSLLDRLERSKAKIRRDRRDLEARVQTEDPSPDDPPEALTATDATANGATV